MDIIPQCEFSGWNVGSSWRILCGHFVIIIENLLFYEFLSFLLEWLLFHPFRLKVIIWFFLYHFNILYFLIGFGWFWFSFEWWDPTECGCPMRIWLIVEVGEWVEVDELDEFLEELMDLGFILLLFHHVIEFIIILVRRL